MSRMGERFLVLDEAAAALDAVDPGLAEQFRLTNGLPGPDGARIAVDGATPMSPAPADPARRHEIRMDVGDRVVRADCSCGAWTSEVGWDGIDAMVLQIRRHLGSDDATSSDGIATETSPRSSERRAG